jgi:urease accessory protein UreH
VLTSTLGPGLLAGDSISRHVDVGAGATLIVAAQMSTPVFAGARTSRNETLATVAADGSLYSPGEPLLLAPRAALETSAELDVSATGLALVADIVVLSAGARIHSRTSARIDGRLVLRDACELEGDGAEPALLSAIVVTANAAHRAALGSALTALLLDHPAVRGGLGATDGAAIVRAHAPGAWALQRLLDTIVALVRATRECAYPAAPAATPTATPTAMTAVTAG